VKSVMRRLSSSAVVGLMAVGVACTLFVLACTKFDPSEEADSGTDAGSPIADGAAVIDGAVIDGAATDAAAAKLVFVLPKPLTAAMVATADGECAIHRPKATAWTSLATTGPLQRVNGNGPWKQPDGRIVFADRAALAAGTLLATINRDIDGKSAGGFVWTGATADGGASGTDCRAWTNPANSSVGTVGSLGSTGNEWAAARLQGCANSYPVICIESD